MEVVQLTQQPFVAIKKDESEDFAIAVGMNVITEAIFTNVEECEQAVAPFTPLFINLVCFLAEHVNKMTKETKDE